ncbi:MAG: hypothetical protein R6T93_00330 [Trueperaceae bacterium]
MSLQRLKVITSNNLDLFQERLDRYLDQLDRDEVVVDVKFSTAALGETIEFSALVQTQKTESWA